MAHSHFQILVLPFRSNSSGLLEFAALRRSDEGYWQGIAGGGETGETPLQAATRETVEEMCISPSRLIALDSVCSIPIHHFPGWEEWPKELFVIPEYSFAVDCTGMEFRLSQEHTEIYWGTYDEIWHRFKWDSNKTALWELNRRLERPH